MFIQENHTKTKLKQKLPVYGVISTSDDPQLAELFGLAGFDYYILDAEHGLIDPVQAVSVIRACELAGITPIVRIGPKDPKLVLQYLDAGMMGVMMPGIETRAEMQMLVDAVKYPPQGGRGVGLARASAYMAYSDKASEYITFANENTLVIPQFEHPALLASFETIFNVPGVDAVMLGPRDLSMAMGFPDGPNHPEVQQVIDQVIAACQVNNLVAGITAGTRTAAKTQIERGAMMILAPAQPLIISAAKQFLNAGDAE
jgi:4-hydroxy-2-oxoheptanedioate aldolase